MGRYQQVESELNSLANANRQPLPFLLIRIAEVETGLALAPGDAAKASNIVEQLGSQRFGVATPLERLEWDILLCRIERTSGNPDSAMRRVAFLANLPFVPGSAYYRHRLLLEEGTTLATIGNINPAIPAGVLRQAAEEAAINGYKPVEEEACYWLSGIYGLMGDNQALAEARDKAEKAAAMLPEKLSKEDAHDFEKTLAERRARRPIRIAGIQGAAPSQAAPTVPPPPAAAASPQTAPVTPPPPAAPPAQPQAAPAAPEASGFVVLPPIEEAVNLTYEAFTDLMSAYEKAYISEVIVSAGGNKQQAAKKLGISRAALYRVMNRLNISSNE
jgi:hypothetical protein